VCLPDSLAVSSATEDAAAAGFWGLPFTAVNEGGAESRVITLEKLPGATGLGTEPLMVLATVEPRDTFDGTGLARRLGARTPAHADVPPRLLADDLRREFGPEAQQARNQATDLGAAGIKRTPAHNKRSAQRGQKPAHRELSR
jgi:hypothetical protein